MKDKVEEIWSRPTIVVDTRIGYESSGRRTVRH